LVFDPWSPTAHVCPRCGKTFSGERHDRHWARYQRLRSAERAAHLATLAALGDNAAAAGRAEEILRGYTRTYWGYANQDNVLGPSRLFFSTYLESIWIGNFLAAGALLRACGRLEKVAAGAVSGVAEEAANLIGEFDEGFSNRQTWNNAALTAIAVWFEDEDLAKRAIEGPTGLLEHLLRGFGRDGMWYEGENYHLFALRGLLSAAAVARPLVHARWVGGGRARMVARESPARVPRARRAAHGRGGPLCEPRVRPVRGRARAPRPAASHPPRRGRALAGRRWNGILRLARSLLVPLDPGAQCATAGRRVPAPGRRGVRDVRRGGGVGLGSWPLRRDHPHRRCRSAVPARCRGAGRSHRARARAAMALSRDRGRGTRDVEGG